MQLSITKPTRGRFPALESFSRASDYIGALNAEGIQAQPAPNGQDSISGWFTQRFQLALLPPTGIFNLNDYQTDPYLAGYNQGGICNAILLLYGCKVEVDPDTAGVPLPSNTFRQFADGSYLIHRRGGNGAPLYLRSPDFVYTSFDTAFQFSQAAAANAAGGAAAGRVAMLPAPVLVDLRNDQFQFRFDPTTAATVGSASIHLLGTLCPYSWLPDLTEWADGDGRACKSRRGPRDPGFDPAPPADRPALTQPLTPGQAAQLRGVALNRPTRPGRG